MRKFPLSLSAPRASAKFNWALAHVALLVATAMLGLSAIPALAQSTQLTIVSPSNGANYSVGSTIQITAIANDPSRFRSVVLGASGLEAKPEAIQKPPYTFILTIPADFSPGALKLVAIGLNNDGAIEFSKPALINIDASPSTDQSVAILEFIPSGISFFYVGEQTQVPVYAKFTDGSSIMVNRSTRFRVSSDNPSVATINSDGVVTAVGPGTANLVASFGGGSAIAPVVVPNNIRGDFDGNGIIDSNDINILKTYLNTIANGPNDARDLNHDGKIDALDLRILTTMCTYPRCASTKP